MYWSSGVLVATKLPVIGQITWMKIIAIFAFFIGLLAMHLVLNMPKLATLLIDTEQHETAEQRTRRRPGPDTRSFLDLRPGPGPVPIDTERRKKLSRHDLNGFYPLGGG